MDRKTLNPMGSDALALAEVIAPRMSATLTGIAERIGMVVAAMSLIALGAVIWAVQLDYEVVAVTPGGALLPLVQLDKKNERAQRALLAANAPVSAAKPEAAPPAAAGSTPTPNPSPATKAPTPNPASRKRSTQQ
jgi:hypothetical protein